MKLSNQGGNKMNINKRMNQIHKEVNQQIEELILLKIEEVEKLVNEEFKILREIDKEIARLYTYPTLPFEEFESMTEPIVDAILLVGANFEDKIRKCFDKIISEPTYKDLFQDALEKGLLQKMRGLPVTPHRARMEFEKARHNFFSKSVKYMNLAINETVQDVRETLALSVESIIHYLEENHVICEEELTEETKQQQNTQLTKITSLKDMIGLVEGRGYEKVRTTGSHHIYRNEKGETTVIPVHGKDFHRGLAYRIQKQVNEGCF